MGKTKYKEKNIEKPIEVAEEKAEAVPSNIGYKGTITVKLSHNGKIVQSNTYHNKGSIYLFEFLSKCVTGQMSNQLVPKFLKLFTFDSIPQTTPSGISEGSIPLAAGMAFNTSSIKTTEDPTTGAASSQATLHFTVPGTSCASTGTTVIKIYQLGLYNTNNESEKFKYSAAFNLINSNNTTWDPIVFNLENGEYNIYVEWTLTFSNAV